MDDHTNMVSDGSICYFCPSLCIYLTNDNDNVNVNEQRGKGSVHVLLLLLIPLLVLCTSMNVLKFVWIRTRYSISFSQGCLCQYRMNGYSIFLFLTLETRCLFPYLVFGIQWVIFTMMTIGIASCSGCLFQYRSSVPD